MKRKRKKKPHVYKLRNDKFKITGWEGVKIADWDSVPKRDQVIEFKIYLPAYTHAVLFNYGVPEP